MIILNDLKLNNEETQNETNRDGKKKDTRK